MTANALLPPRVPDSLCAVSRPDRRISEKKLKIGSPKNNNHHLGTRTSQRALTAKHLSWFGLGWDFPASHLCPTLATVSNIQQLGFLVTAEATVSRIMQ